MTSLLSVGDVFPFSLLFLLTPLSTIPACDNEHRQLPENKACADCKGPSPRWASTNLGVFLCISCSGIHRKIGTHISQVRSITLDTWTPSQMSHFTKFGNAKAEKYFEACLPSDFRRPNSNESTLMERFIRDKYENKRYITVENGGLGGGPLPTSSFGAPAYGYPSGGLGRRPQQPVKDRPYDTGYDGSSRRTGGSSMSYGGRFNSGGMPNVSGSRVRTTGGGYSAKQNVGIPTRPGNAMQRAGTLKQLLDMGFSTELAGRAVEVSEGDLQRAIDWVLQNKNSRGLPPQAASNPVPKRLPKETVKDLLDFDGPLPTSKPAVKAPKAASFEPLTQAPPPQASPANLGNDGFADFADFGAFECALPTTKPTGTEQPSAPPNGTLGALASLYKQSPPRAPLSSSGGVGQIQKTSPSHGPGGSRPSIPQFAKLATVHTGLPNRNKFVNPKQTTRRNPSAQKPLSPLMQVKSPITPSKPSKEDLGLTTFNSLSPANLPPTSRDFSKNSPPPPKPIEGQHSNGHVVPPQTPPPPPMQDAPAPRTTDAPPPTTTPPRTPQQFNLQNKPITEPNGQGVEGGVEKNSSDKSQTPEATATKTADPKQEEPAKEEENEDPFAALSMMALSSATSTLKTGKPQAKSVSVEPRETSDQGTTTKSDPSGNPPAPVATPHNTNGGISLEDFFG